MTYQKHHSTRPPDFSETKAHIFVAGHELLRAAEGVLKYCKYYVETTGERSKHKNLIKIFSDGIKIAKDLGVSMTKDLTVHNAAGKVMRHFCNVVEKEICREKETKGHRKTKTHKKAKHSASTS